VPAGRPSALTEEFVDRLVEAVARGERLETAARNAGASPRSLRRWRRAGREQLQALAPEGRLERRLELALQQRNDESGSVLADVGDWRAAARALEQINPARWGPQGGLDELLADLAGLS
jgi:transposase-like protein